MFIILYFDQCYTHTHTPKIPFLNMKFSFMNVSLMRLETLKQFQKYLE